MKRLASICYGLFLGTVLLYTQQIRYKTIEDTIMSEDGDIYVRIPLEKQGNPVRKDTDVVYSMGNDFGFSDLREDYYSVIFAETDEKPAGYFILDSLERDGMNHEIHSIINGTWITAYTYDILYANSKDQITKYEPYWGMETEYSRFDRDSWEDVISPTKLIMTDNSFYIYSGDRNWRDFLFVSEKEENGHFFIEVYTRGRNNPYYYDEGNFIARFTESEKKGFYIEMDGGYLKLFEDGLDVKPLMIFARTDDYWGITEKLRAIARGEKADLSDVTWPRHADGSCDYEDENGITTASETQGMESENASAKEAAIPKPAPDMGKTAVVTENLRIRSDYNTTAEVVATLAAGTRVKILAPGREDTIDGIASNWLQVRVLDGAKDKDGNTIEAGTKGWLFGGYLSTTEYVEPAKEEKKLNLSDSLETKDESKVNNIVKMNKKEENDDFVFPFIQVGFGIILIIVLLPIILAIAKRRKTGKE